MWKGKKSKSFYYSEMIAVTKKVGLWLGERKNKKIVGFVGGIVLLFLLFGVGDSISNNIKLSTLQDEKSVLESNIVVAKEENDSAQKKLKEQDMLIKDLEVKMEVESNKVKKIENEYNQYKKKMEPYEELQAEEAEVKAAELKKQREEEAVAKAQAEAEKKAAAEQAAAEKKAAEEQAKAEEKARKEEEEARGYETGITYDQLARTPDDYTLQKIKFYGKVVQVMEGDATTQVRLAVDDNYDTILYCEVPKSLIENNRILEDDYVTFSGVSYGLLSYKSTLGGTITIPSMVVDKIDR